MRKRYFILALAAALVLTLLPAAAAAAAAGDVCQIGTTGYSSLLTAISSAQDGDTIRLLTDTTCSQPVAIASKNVTIDLNNHTVTMGPTTQYVLDVEQGSSLQLQGEGALNVVSNSGSSFPAVNVQDGSSAQVTNVTASNGGIGVSANGSGSTVRIFGSVIASGSDCIGARADGGAQITIDGALTSEATYISGDGVNKAKSDKTTPTTKTGYDTYTGGTSTIWVLYPELIVSGSSGGYSYAHETLKITANGTYTVSMAEGITQATRDHIAVAPGLNNVNITLNSVSIDLLNMDTDGELLSETTGVCAFDIQGGSSVNLTLSGDNVLKSGTGQPGLHVPSNSALVIDGDGSLYAKGSGSNSISGGAGIGGNGLQTGGTIEICGGTISAYGGFCHDNGSGAGIGGGGKGDGGIITITGGIVEAYGGSYPGSGGGSGAGIGGGSNCGTVTIAGGRVSAYGGKCGAGIGGGVWGKGNGGAVAITGGTVYARGGDGDINFGGAPGIGGCGGGMPDGSSHGGAAGRLTISGGSIQIVNGSGHDTGSINPPKDTANRALSLTKIGFPDDGDKLVSLLEITLVQNVYDGGNPFGNSTPYDYGITDMYTDSLAVLYLYLPSGNPHAVVTVAEVEGNYFKGSVTAGSLTGSFEAAYAVRFDTGAGSPVPNLYYLIGQSVRISRPITRPDLDNYDFINWYADPECETLFNFENTIISGPTTIYAKWNLHQYEITYYLGGGTNDPGNPTSYTVKSDDITLAPPTRVDHDFVGWSGSDTIGVIRSVTIPKGSTGDRQFVAFWHATGTRVVTFNSQGGSPATQTKTVKVNTLVTPPKTPVKTGYSFKGWYREPLCIYAWNFSESKVMDNTTLYAKWTPKTYTVTFDSRGGSAVHYVRVVYDTLVTKPADPMRYGYDFGGWYKESACTNAWVFDTDHMTAKSITLYAKWNIHKWNVTFDAKGGEFIDNGVSLGSSLVRESVPYYSLLYAPLIPTRAHYTFKGWYKNEACTSPWYFSTSRTPDRNLTLYVKWQPDAFKITFNSQGGTKVYSKTGYWDKPIAKPANPTRTGFTFGGWFKDADCTDDWVFGTGGDVVTGAVTLYAKWTPKIYTVTFNPSGGTIGGSPIQMVDYGKTISLLRPEKTGYYFGGWYTSKYFTTQWNFGKPVTKNMTLYAKWMMSQYKITFKANASGVSNLPAPIYAECYEIPPEPAQPMKTGYIFGGWYKSSTYFTVANRFNFGTTMLTGSVTLYARWLNKLATPKLTAVADGADSVAITISGVPYATSYKLSYSTGTAGPWTDKNITGTSSTVGEMEAGQTYYFKVQAIRESDGATFTSAVSPVVSEAPGKPGSVTATAASYNTIHVEWSGSDIYRNTGYEVWRATSLKGTYTKVGTTASAVLSFDNTVYTGKTYYYKVRAYRQVGSAKSCGEFSYIVSAKAQLEMPDSFVAGSSGATSVTASWNAVDGASGYELWRATAVTGVFRLLKCTTSLSYKNTGLVTNQPYYYKVRAYRYVLGRKIYSYFTDVKTAAPSDF